MKRVVVDHYGGPEVVKVVEAEVPKPGPGEVRVRVLAAGVSFTDSQLRAGTYIGGPKPPFTPGYELVGVVEALATYGGQLHDIRMAQGRRREIAQLFIDAATENPTIPSLRNAAIGLCFEIGDVDEARRRYANEVAHGFTYPRTAQWFGAMEGAVDANLVIGDTAGAAILYEELLPYADRAVYQIATPARPVARSLGCLATRLGRYDEAEEHFGAALESMERLGAVYWIARTLLDHCDLCVARGAPGDDVRKRDLATRAIEMAREFGLAGLETRANAMLASA